MGRDEQSSKQAFREMSVTQKMLHVWYYYKWAIIFGAFVLVFLAVCLVQCSTKGTNDAMILYIGDHYLPIEYVRSLNSDLERIMEEDLNGDGEKQVDFLQIRLDMYTPEGYGNGDKKEIYEPERQVETLERIEVETATGQAVVYILEPTLYEKYSFLLANLEDVLGFVPEGAVDEKGILISSLEAYDGTYLSYIPENSIIGIRAMRTEGNVFTKKDDPESYEANAEFFKRLVEYKGE